MNAQANEEAVQDLADDLQQMCEHSWYRFCLQKIDAPQMWPASIRMAKTVTSDVPGPDLGYILREGETYRATSNRYGAVCGLAENGQLLGVKSSEFEIATWQSDRPATEKES